jgi:hypothetical protein
MYWLCFERNGRTVAVVIIESDTLIGARMRASIAGLGAGGAFTAGHPLDGMCIAALAPEDVGRNLSPKEAEGLLKLFERARRKKPPAASVRRRIEARQAG